MPHAPHQALGVTAALVLAAPAGSVTLDVLVNGRVIVARRLAVSPVDVISAPVGPIGAAQTIGG